MNPAAYESGEWQRKRQNRMGSKNGRARFNPWQLGLGLAYFLVAAACWGILAIYGPVLGTEVVFQLHRVKLIKTISFDLVPQALASGYAIVIPKLYLQEPVIPNVDPNSPVTYREALNRGIALAAGTGLPGEGGLGYYFAHSSGMNVLAPQKQATFYLLGKLQVGDEVDIYREKLKYRYRVTGTKITTPEDVSFLQPTGDKEQIVLQTCWPIGTSLQRLLVTAEKLD
jgi:LPXTG-site transpeptidase (sortase) family protein